MAYIVMAYIVMAYIAMVYIVMAYIVMAGTCVRSECWALAAGIGSSRVRADVCTHLYTRVQMHVQCSYTCLYTCSIHESIRMYMQTSMNTPTLARLCTRLNEHTPLSKYAYTHVSTRSDTCLCACLYTRQYTC